MKRFFSLVVALIAMQLMFAAKIQVTNTSGDPTVEGSLPWACETGTSSDTIVFKFSTSGKKVINISTALSPTASIDGSTYSDSIIIDGSLEDGGHVPSGLSSTGAFVKNIVVQNCIKGFVTSRNSKIINCVIRDNTTDGISHKGGETIEKCKITNNGHAGITSYDTPNGISIIDCEISDNKEYGVYAYISTMKGTSLLNNHIGLYADLSDVTKEISNCVISGNDSIGVLFNGSVNLFSNNIVGLSQDQRTPNPNGIGVRISGRGSIENFTDNVISGNTGDGIYDESRAGIRVFTGNYVGTNKYFDAGHDFGNNYGMVPSSTGSFTEFSHNYFGNNHSAAIYSESTNNTSLVLDECYIGVSPDGKNIGNHTGIEVGVSYLTLNNCQVSYNSNEGIIYNNTNLTISGGEISHNWRQAINLTFIDRQPNIDVKNVVFKGKGFDYNLIHVFSWAGFGKTLFSGNKIMNTLAPYLDIYGGSTKLDYNKTYPKPVFTSCKLSTNSVSLEGKVDTAAKAKIELYLTKEGPYNATEFIDSFYTDKDGSFSITLSNDQFEGISMVSFVATATYGNRNTSLLSEPVAPEPMEIDLTRSSYYVKTDGMGDGSSWEKAMSPQSFAYTLPQVGDGVTFYVAEGTYKPVYDHMLNMPSAIGLATFFVQSNVTINGGYPKDAKTGAVADPDNYKTIFSGDMEGNDVMILYNNDIVAEEHTTLDDAAAIFTLAQQGDRLNPYGGLGHGDYFHNLIYLLAPNSTPQDNGKKKYFNLNGVSINGGGVAVWCLNPNIRISIDNSSFSNMSLDAALEFPYGPLKVEISNSDFYRCRNTTSITDADSVEFRNVKISESGGLSYYINYTKSKRGFIHFDGLEYMNNLGGISVNDGAPISPSYIFMENSKFENNQSLINSYRAELVAKNCSFKDNVGNLDICQAHANFENCEFVGNESDIDHLGYFLSAEGPNEQSILEDNYSPKLTSSKIKNCTFKSNKCGTLCHMPYHDVYSADSIIGCSFEENLSKELFTSNTYSNNNLIIESSTIKNNETEDFINGANNLHINNSLFEGNIAKGFESPQMTSVYTYNLYVSNSTFKGNEVDSIFFVVTRTAKFANDTIEGNSTKLIVDGFYQGLDVERCLFKGNEGGLFYCQNTDQDTRVRMKFWNSDFTGNNITSDDDMIHLYGKDNDEINISETNFNNNSAHTLMDIHDGNTTIFKCDFFGNKISGEFIHLPEVTSLIEASTFRQNELTGGNLIYTPYGELTLYNNTFASNKLKNGLFSVYPSAANVYIYNNTIIANETTATSLVGGSLKNHALIGNIIGDKITRGFDEDSI